jgi:hypothetical protein
MARPHARSLVAFALALAAAGGLPAQAHHSASMFDFAHPITVEGTVKEFNWSNPHISVDLYVEGDKGAPGKLWTIEASSVGVMSRAGWSKHTLNPGDRVKILCSPLRDGGAAGSITSVTFANGKTLTWLTGSNQNQTKTP